MYVALAKRCEYMVLRSDEECAARAKKDPRDLHVLDPACGSGHFLWFFLCTSKARGAGIHSRREAK